MISEDTFEFSVAKGQKLKFNFWVSNDELKYLSVTDDHQTRPWNTWLSLNNNNGKNKMPVKQTESVAVASTTRTAFFSIQPRGQ